MKTFITILVSVLVSLATIFVWNWGVEKQEKAECMKFQEQALEYPDFFLTQWQKEMCDTHGIFVDAPVNKLPRF